MSSKTKSTATKEDGKPALVPKLRFPEFRGAVLRNVRLGDVTAESESRNGKKHSASVVMGVTKVDGIVPMEARLIAADIARYKLVHNNWFAYNPMRLNIGSIARWKGNNEILVSPDYVVFRCLTEDEAGIVPAYLDHFRQTKAWEAFVKEGGDGSVRVRIYYKDIAGLRIALPSFAEQQRIAECLSSVDEAIAAQARKVDALKTHKKGLMQQLFPRPERIENGVKVPAESQPRLRFPEFRGAKRWEQATLGEKSSILKGKGISKADLDPNGSQACIRYGELYTRYGETIKVAVSRTKVPASELFLSKPDDVIIPSSGETKIDIAKASCVLAGGIALGGDLNVIRSKLNGTFLSYYLNGPKRLDIAKVAQGDTVVHLYPHQLEALQIAVPSPAEQQKIAECLSSVDEVIAAQARKVDALKTHKKGLMQQLFPSPEEAEA